MMIITAQTVAQTVTETAADAIEIVQEVQQDLGYLKPNVIIETAKGWIPNLIQFGCRLLLAILIIAIGMRIAKIVRKMLKHSFERMEMEISLRKFLLSLINAILYLIIGFMAAEKIGVDSTSVLAIMGSAGLALGLALQGSLSNFAGGVLILMMRPFKVGDYIICSGGEGTVATIGLVYTVLNTADNRKVVIPNGNLSNAPLTNVTAQVKRRVDLVVGIGYQADLKQAKDIIHRIFSEHPKVMREEPLDIFVDNLSDSAVMIGARCWTATENYWEVKWELMESVKLSFDEVGIEIPFKQLDVHIMSGEGN